jgi:hypothetical protein
VLSYEQPENVEQEKIRLVLTKRSKGKNAFCAEIS